jgi:pyridoxamine 5'-phosphate oxidase family protein
MSTPDSPTQTVEFTDAEKAYIKGQRLARIATTSDDLLVDVAPVAFRFDGERFHVGGMNLKPTHKYRNVKANGRAAIAVDDLESVDPWRPRGVKVSGSARIVTRPDGREVIEITPEHKSSWGL